MIDPTSGRWYFTGTLSIPLEISMGEVDSVSDGNVFSKSTLLFDTGDWMSAEISFSNMPPLVVICSRLRLEAPDAAGLGSSEADPLVT
jgi:hypothetical protein